MRTRDEHLSWAKKRALEYLDKGDVNNAIASMGSDLMKHDELAQISAAMTPMGLFIILQNDPTQARRWIEGFR
jgi:hypothetical protein